MPKPLAPVAGRPFLDHLLGAYAASGAVRHVVLALGHLADAVIRHYRDVPPPLPVDWVVETEPLGTGGALLNALPATRTETVLVANGDSLIDMDIHALLAHHRASGAGLTLALTEVDDVGRFGRVLLDGSRVAGFAEKAAGGGRGAINAGVYVLDRALLAGRPPGPLSMEQDIIPRLVAEGRVQAVTFHGAFIDIGLPETYAEAPAFVERLRRRTAKAAGATPDETQPGGER
ncbi:sugar phosphate nucleotidyltransferase [Azospirillum formosense]|uniref:sugar phosphate nucleotidyltransferase n=1 Tax=Azospirillum formosense TaxID=861533 RepID=UPI00338DA477